VGQDPQRFGKYVLLRRIALGGMAEIFKAKVAGAEGFERDLVIKRILPHFSEDEEFVSMFVDEARITARLQHQNIVQVFDFDAVDDSYYSAMEYIAGKDLKDVLEEADKRGDRLSVAQCVWVAVEVSKGLHYAHTKDDHGQPLNIVHRDVSPSNVMLSYRGDVKLMDFGIAKAAQRSTKTQAGAVKGKVAYMSPEQARGKPLDGRSDLFALGVMLWEMLTGRRLFLADSDFDTLNNVLKLEAKPPSSVNRDVPKEVDAIVAKALAKDPGARWPTVEAFGRELTRWFYATVEDLEREKLKPLMHRLFKQDIDAEERATEDERVGVGGARPTADFDGESTSMMAAVDDDAGPVSEERTRMDMVAAEGATTMHRPGELSGKPAGKRTPTEAHERPRTATRTSSRAFAGPVAARRRRSWLPWIVLATIVLVVGGVLAAWLATRGEGGDERAVTPEGETAATPSGETAATVRGETAAIPSGEDVAVASARERAKVFLKVTPHTARVTIDGEPVADEKGGIELGAVVRIVAEAPDYERWEELVEVDAASKVVAITLTKKGVPQRIMIKPSDDNDEVSVDGKRLGLGPQTFEGVVGQVIVVEVAPLSGGAKITRTITLDGAQTLVSIATPGELLVSLDPAAATLEASAGVIEVRAPGLVAVKGLEIGATLELEAKAPGHKPLKRSFAVTQAQSTLALALEKEATAPVAAKRKGSIAVSAKPWAQITINGKLHGRTPVTVKDLAAGSYTVVFTKGAQKVTKVVAVSAGKASSIFVDFTTL